MQSKKREASRIFSFLKVAIFLLLPVIMQIWVSSTSVVAVVVLCIDFPDEERRLPFFSISILPRSTSSTINGGRCAVGSLQYDIRYYRLVTKLTSVMKNLVYWSGGVTQIASSENARNSQNGQDGTLVSGLGK